MPYYRLTANSVLIALATLGGLALVIAGFLFVSHVFGLSQAATLLVLVVPPLLVAGRLHHRWPSVRRHEIAYLTILCCISAGATVFVVRDWYANGIDHRHAEKIQWTKLERLMRQDPAFRDIKIKLTDRKHIYWAEGTVAAEEDLDRLKSLASDCGIKGRLEGPFAHSVSLRVSAQRRKVPDH